MDSGSAGAVDGDRSLKEGTERERLSVESSELEGDGDGDGEREGAFDDKRMLSIVASISGG